MKKCLFLVPVLCLSMNSHANDLDDGMGGGGISSTSDLTMKKNIPALKRKAKAAIARGKQGKSGGRSYICGSGNIVVEKGAGVKSVVNLSDNKGSVAVCGK